MKRTVVQVTAFLSLCSSWALASMRMTKAQRNVTAVAGLVAGIVADQIVDPLAGMIGHVGMRLRRRA